MKEHHLLFIIGLIFLGVYSYLATPLANGAAISPRFDWPDETANFFWITQYADTSQLVVPEALNVVAENQIHPRSFNVLTNGALVPGSFLGFILFYGTIAKVLGSWSIIYLTPLLSVLGVFAFYGCVKKVFSRQAALVAAGLLFFHPAWWYYSVTSLLPNVAFISCLLISSYLLLRDLPDAEEKQQWVEPGEVHSSLTALLLAGLFAGLAIAIRPSELIWIVVVYVVVLLAAARTLSVSRLLAVIAIAVAVLLPTVFYQQSIYGSWLTTGYDQLNTGNQSEAAVGSTCQLCGVTKQLIAPFGLHPTLVGYNIWIHYLSRFWQWSLLAVLGVVALLAQPKRWGSRGYGYLLLSFFIGLWLAIYYGSWQFTDQLTVNLNTLGLSYVRYWLPLYILALPFVALGMIWLANFLPKKWRPVLLLVIAGFILYPSAELTLWAKPDSLLPVRERIAEYKAAARTVIDATEPEAVIVTVRKDKVFFPERKVIHTFSALSLNSELSHQIAQLVAVVPVYYYALGPEPTLELTSELHLEEITRVGQEVLYQIK